MSLIEELQARVAELEAAQHQTERVAEINFRLSSATTESEILEAVAALAAQYQVTSSALAFAETDLMGEVIAVTVVAAQNQNAPAMLLEPEAMTRFSLAQLPLLGLALQTPDQPLFIENLLTDPRTEAGDTRAVCQDLGIGAAIVMWFQSGLQMQGLMTFTWNQPQPFQPELRAIFQAIQPMATAALANRRLLLDIQSLAIESSREADIYRSLVENSADGILVLAQTDQQIVYGNEVSYRLLGYDYAARALLEVRFTDLWPPEVLAQLRDEIVPTIWNTGHWSGEVRLQRLDGSIFDANITAYLMMVSGDDTPRLCMILRDVSARKQVEAEREQLQQQVIEAQRLTLQELSTPIIPVLDRVIVMPLVGAIDTLRSRDLMRALLEGVTRYQAEVAILDITGVPVVDSGVADHLNRTIQAARLKGTHTIVTGVSEAVAETIVDLGIDWSGFETLRDLQTGLMAALTRLGIHLTLQKSQ